MINYGKHYIDKSDLLSVLKTLKKGNLTQGNQIFKFESSLNKYFGSKYVCVLSNATAGLYLLSELLKWKKNFNLF
jgi:dTDP-4-amino-4,6-dideoxygalactose transaminase